VAAFSSQELDWIQNSHDKRAILMYHARRMDLMGISVCSRADVFVATANLDPGALSHGPKTVNPSRFFKLDALTALLNQKGNMP